MRYILCTLCTSAIGNNHQFVYLALRIVEMQLKLVLFTLIFSFCRGQTPEPLSSHCSYTFFVPRDHNQEGANSTPVASLQRDVNQVKGQLSQLRNQNADQQQQMTNLQTQVTSLLQQNAELLAENNQLRQQGCSQGEWKPGV